MATLSATGNCKVQPGFSPLLSEFIHVDFDDIEAIKKYNENKDIEEVDPWKNWVFELYGYGNANGEKSYKYLNLSSGISLQKVTPDIKIEINLKVLVKNLKFMLKSITHCVQLVTYLII